MPHQRRRLLVISAKEATNKKERERERINKRTGPDFFLCTLPARQMNANVQMPHRCISLSLSVRGSSLSDERLDLGFDWQRQ